MFDDAGPQVRAGCSGWLFLGEEVWEVKDGDRNIALRLAIAKAMASTFARRGVRLVMLTVPDKARVAASELCRQRVSPQSAARLALWSRLVRDVPMPKVNIVDGWPFKPGYWRTDTHWDREGARFAAERTAAVVEALLGGRGAEQATVTQATQEERRPGDLMHVSNLENAPRWLQPPPDMERPVSVNWKHIGSLLDAGPASDVVLVGSSYSKNSGFLDALGLALGREIVQLSEEGGGFDGALFDLLHRHRNTLANAKVVIWEFPERSLTQALTPDEHAFLHR
jgi:alginate O-acetyltransferase complex protein AlgJ